LNTITRARQETGDPEFLIESLINTIIPPEERHETGLTVEDRQMTNLLSAICIRNHNDRVIDIASGTCAILGSAYDRLKQLKTDNNMIASHQRIMRQISAIESNQFIAKIGVLRFVLKNPLKQTIFDLSVKDTFNVRPQADKNAVLCNPPYLRQADIPQDYKRLMRRKIAAAYRRQRVRGNFPYSQGQADKYFYFVEWGLLFLRPGGIAGFILSDKFLNSQNGVHLKRFFKEQTKLISIIKYTGKFFEGFDVTTCFIIAQRKEDGEDIDDNSTRFIRLHSEISETRVLELLESEEGINTSEARVVVERQGDLNPNEKWGKKLLNLPETYEDCYDDEIMVTLGEAVDGVRKRGKDNGCNAVFFPKSTGFNKGRGEPQDDFTERRDDHREDAQDLIDNIERRFLKKAINSGDVPRHFILENADINRELLLVVPPETDIDQYPGLDEFLEFAEETYTDANGDERALLDGNKLCISERPTAGGRDPWYSLYPQEHSEDNYAIIIPRMHRATFKILIPQENVYFSTNFVGFGSRDDMDEDDVKFIVGFLMSSLGQLQFEAESDWREGLLKIEAGRMYPLKVPDPSEIEDDIKEEIIEKFEELEFGINGLERPGEQNPRFELDMAIMKIFYPENQCEAKALEIEEALYQTVLERDPENKTR